MSYAQHLKYIRTIHNIGISFNLRPSVHILNHIKASTFNFNSNLCLIILKSTHITNFYYLYKFNLRRVYISYELVLSILFLLIYYLCFQNTALHKFKVTAQDFSCFYFNILQKGILKHLTSFILLNFKTVFFLTFLSTFHFWMNTMNFMDIFVPLTANILQPSAVLRLFSVRLKHFRKLCM